MDPELEIMTVSQFLSTISYSAADLRFTPNGEVNSLFRVFRYEIWISGIMHRKSAPVNMIHYKWSVLNTVCSIIKMDRLLTQASCTVTHWVHVVFARAAPSSFFGPTTITHRGDYLQVLRVSLWSPLFFTSILLYRVVFFNWASPENVSRLAPP